MRTNFAHLKQYKKIYELSQNAEKFLVGGEGSNETAAVSIRQAIEGLLIKLCHAYGIVMDAKASPNAMINELFYRDIITRKSKQNLHDIREDCNNIVHYKDAEDENTQSLQRIEHQNRQKLEEVYSRFYIETYKIASYYLTDTAVKNYKAQYSAGQHACRNNAKQNVQRQSVSNQQSTPNQKIKQYAESQAAHANMPAKQPPMPAAEPKQKSWLPVLLTVWGILVVIFLISMM